MENLELAKLVLKQIEAMPEQFDMDTYFTTANECGTTACLAGWAMLLTPGYELKRGIMHGPDGKEVDSRYYDMFARNLLGLTDDEYVDDDGEELFHLYTNEEALDRFRYLVETEEKRRAQEGNG